MAIKRGKNPVSTFFKDAVVKAVPDGSDMNTVGLSGGDINDLKLVVGIKIAGEPDDLISKLPSGK